MTDSASKDRNLLVRLEPDTASWTGYHPSFTLPDDLDAFIWRYQDFAKLLHMLQRSRLFFSRIDALGDRFEGSFPLPHRERRPKRYLEIGMEPTEERLREWSERTRRLRESIYVNCWHLNEAESAAMWDLYARSGVGIAVRSTPMRLNESIDWDRWLVPVFVGMVRYLDYTTEMVGEDNAFDPVMAKRRSFAHERELRAAMHISNDPAWREIIGKDISQAGVYVPVKLDTLIESIWIAPGSPAWFGETVERAVRDTGLGSVPVHQSQLDSEPFF